MNAPLRVFHFHQELLTLEADGFNYSQTEFNPDGNLVGSAMGQGVLRLWHAPAWKEISASEAIGNGDGAGL